MTFDELTFASSKTVSWIHIGDLHMTRSGEQNEIDLGRIVDEINAVYAGGGVDFVFLPGDIADDGSAAAYKVVRSHLDRLQLPWLGIVGDHDVHEESFQNFQEYISNELYSRFTIGPYCFLRLNAFSAPKPDSFTLDEKQLAWLERELAQSEQAEQRVVLLLHCYPSDLKNGAERLVDLLRRYSVLLIDMGHTHYNEVSNDGRILYSATRSTGQIEEGQVGYSLTTIDQNQISWQFVPLDSSSAITITQPMDERLLTERSCSEAEGNQVLVHAKIWSARHRIREVYAQMQGITTTLASEDGMFWKGSLHISSLGPGAYELKVIGQSEDGELTSAIRFRVGPLPERTFDSVDQNNSIGEWQERGLLNTQLGPNKNGKKW